MRILYKAFSKETDPYRPNDGLIACINSSYPEVKIDFIKKPDMQSEEVTMKEYRGFNVKTCEFTKQCTGTFFKVAPEEFLKATLDEINGIENILIWIIFSFPFLGG